jgi:predicted nucleic acid-binding protein
MTLEQVPSESKVFIDANILTNDSLIVTTMKVNRLKLLASNDGDFENIPGIQLFKPSDL